MRSNGPPTGSRRVTSASMSAVAEGSADPSARAGLTAPNKIEVTASHDLSKYRRLLSIAALTFRQCLLAASRECREGASRCINSHPTSSWLHDDLPVHPGMRRTNVVVDPRLHEGDGLRLAFGQSAGAPFALLERRGIVRQIADIGERHRGPGLDPRACRPVSVFHVVVADLDRVGPGSNRSDGSGNVRRRRRSPQRTQLPFQREGPDGVAVRAALKLIAASRDGDVLLAVDLVDHRRCVGAKTGLEPPQLLASLGVERQKMAVGLAAEHEAAGGHRRATAAADAVRRFVLPGDLIGLRVDRRERAGHRRADRRGLRAADIALPAYVLVAVTRERAGAHRSRHIEIPGVGAVRHRRPVGAADPRWLDQHWGLPESLENAADLVIAGHRLVDALRHGRVADRVGLRFGGLLPRLLGHRALLDADQRLSIGAVEDVDPAGSPGFGDALARHAVDDGVEQHDRACRVIVPNVVMYLLEMPDILAGLGLERHQRRAEQVVALTHRSVIIRSAIADREVDKAELGIERWRVPDRGATAHRMVGARRPGVAPDLAGTRQRVPPPQDRTGLGVERSEPAAHAELAAGDAAIDDAVIVEWRAGDAVAVLPLFDRRLPSELPGFHVDRYDVGVELAEKQQALAHGETAVDP